METHSQRTGLGCALVRLADELCWFESAVLGLTHSRALCCNTVAFDIDFKNHRIYPSSFTGT